MNRKYFTVEEANDSLVLVKPIVKDIVLKRKKMIKTKEKLNTITNDRRLYISKKHIALNWILSTNDIKKEYKRLKSEMRCISRDITYNLEELEMIGCYLKDFEIGVIDFPSVLDRRVVFLSWQLGEKTVNNWHEVVHSYDKNKVIKSLT